MANRFEGLGHNQIIKDTFATLKANIETDLTSGVRKSWIDGFNNQSMSAVFVFSLAVVSEENATVYKEKTESLKEKSDEILTRVKGGGEDASEEEKAELLKLAEEISELL